LGKEVNNKNTIANIINNYFDFYRFNRP